MKNKILDQEIDEVESIPSFLIHNSHLLLFLAIAVIFIKTYDLLYFSHPGFYLPNTSILLHFIPDIFIVSQYNFETRFHPIDLFLSIATYLALLGIAYSILKKKEIKINNNFKLFHVLLSSSLAILFFFTMIEDKMVHQAIDSGYLKPNYFEARYEIFLISFFLWLALQILAPIIYWANNKFFVK